MSYDLYPAVDEDYLFAPAVREANALTPEFRSQVVPMTETQRNNLTGDELWTHRMIFNTTTFRINRYDGSAWKELSGEAPGIVKMFAGATAPDGHALCQGQVVSRSGVYAALFTIIGTTYNTGGETSTEFRLPNLKGRIPVGVDAGQAEFNVLGETGGAKTHTLTSGEMPAHGHSGTTGVENQGHQHGGNTNGVGDHLHSIAMSDAGGLGGGGTLVRKGGTGGENTGSAGAHAHSFVTDGENASHDHNVTVGNTGGGGAHNNLQPYIAVNYIITL